MKKKTVFALLGAAAAGVLVAGGLPYHMDTSFHKIRDERIHGMVRICVLSDLHCRRFGKRQSAIMNMVDAMHPDIVVIPGDLFDTDRDYEISFELIRALRDYPVYFTSGNHDNYLPEMEELRERLTRMGVHVLEDASEYINVNGNLIEIAGMTDRGRKPGLGHAELASLYHSNSFRILISHRPNFVKFYQTAPVDLIISGHAHGGQWRIPFTHQGLIAPQAGLFPRYTEGMHDLKGRKFVISRGLASGDPHVPRLYNNPEIVFIDIHEKD